VDEDDAAGTSVAEDCVASEETGSEVRDNASEDTDGAVAVAEEAAAMTALNDKVDAVAIEGDGPVPAAAAAAEAGEVSSFCGVSGLTRLCGDDADAATELVLLLLLPAADLEGVSALNASISCAADAWRPCGNARCGGGVPPVLEEVGNVKAAFVGEALAAVTGAGEGVAGDGTAATAATADAIVAGSGETD
jgi:hypothetical protein